MRKVLTFIMFSVLYVSCSNNNSTPEPIVPENPDNNIQLGVSPTNMNATLKLYVKGYNIKVDWGDGSQITYGSGANGYINEEVSHTYTSYGAKVVKVGTTQLAVFKVLSQSMAVSSVTINSCPVLTDLLVIDQKAIESIDLSKCPNLSYLSCSGSGLKALSVDANMNLKQLMCDRNNLTNISLKNNSLLEDFDCRANQLTTLDLQNLSNLRFLECSYNQLESIDLKNNKRVVSLLCDTNKIASLDLSNNTDLNTFACRKNMLTSLDLSKNTFLVAFVCADNQITSIKLPTTSVLIAAYCNRNKMEAPALNNIFNDLALGNANYKINIKDNPGESVCDKTIATNKGWAFDTNDFMLF